MKTGLERQLAIKTEIELRDVLHAVEATPKTGLFDRDRRAARQTLAGRSIGQLTQVAHGAETILAGTDFQGKSGRKYRRQLEAMRREAFQLRNQAWNSPKK